MPPIPNFGYLNSMFLFTLDKPEMDGTEREIRHFLINRIRIIHELQGKVYKNSDGKIFFILQAFSHNEYNKFIALSLSKFFETGIAVKNNSENFFKIVRINRTHNKKIRTGELNTILKSLTGEFGNLGEPYLFPEIKKGTYTMSVMYESGIDTIAMRVSSDLLLNKRFYDNSQNEYAIKLLATIPKSTFDQAKPLARHPMFKK